MLDPLSADPFFIQLLVGVVIGATLTRAGQFVRRILRGLLSLAALLMIYVLLTSGPDELIQGVQSVVLEGLRHPAALLGVLVGAAVFHDADRTNEMR